MYAANEPNLLGSISYRIQQVEPQFLMAYILTSGPVLYGVEVDGCDPQSIGSGRCTTQWKRAFTKGAYLRSFFAAFINVAYTRFKVDKGIMDALVHLVARVV